MFGEGGNMVDLKKEVQYIKGVGPNKATLLNKLDIYTLDDLITYYPRTYEDRGKTKPIAELHEGDEALINAIAISKLSEVNVRKNMTIQKLMVQDESGACTLTWFNQPYLKTKFVVGCRYQFYGKVSIKYGKIEMASPVFDEKGITKNTGKIVPIYPSTFKLSQNTIRAIMDNALNLLENGLEETIPEYIKVAYNLEEVNKAIRDIHFPKDFKDFEKARKRFVFEELLSMQLGLMKLKNKYTEEEEGIQFDKTVKMLDIINKLPFHLTRAQIRVLEEIDNDMEYEIC